MTFGIINPGTEPLRDAKLDLAAEAVLRFVEDLRTPGLGFEPIDDMTVSRALHPGAIDGKHPDQDNPEGWFDFRITRGHRVCYVSTPGVPFEIARGTPERGCMEGPRLYVEGESWWWPFALGVAHRALSGFDTDNEVYDELRDSNWDDNLAFEFFKNANWDA